VAKDSVLTWGDLALCLKGRSGPKGPESEKSAEVVLCAEQRAVQEG